MKHTIEELSQQSLELCWAIEELPASEQQTAISIKASALCGAIRELRDSNLTAKLEAFEELRRAINSFVEVDKMGFTDVEVWKTVELALQKANEVSKEQSQ